MPITFNSILVMAGIDPVTVRLLRHQDQRTDRDRTPYLLWRNHPADFITYQARQSGRKVGLFGSAAYWAVFVRTPMRENLFAGLYSVGQSRPAELNAPSVSVLGTVETGADDVVFDLTKSDKLKEYDGRLAIKWGSAALAWAQYAHANKKYVEAIYPSEPEPPFPGYLQLITTLAEIPGIYKQWEQRLREARGVYVLTCPKSQELYVGSATGRGGFYERWCQHAAKSGDAVKFRTREPQDYQVAILEVGGSNASDRDIWDAEYRWMKKLQTNIMGLNGGLIAPDARRGKPHLIRSDLQSA